MTSNDRLLEDTSMKNISKLAFERQVSMFGHVPRLSSNNPTHGAVFSPALLTKSV